MANLKLDPEKQPVYQLDQECALKNFCRLMAEDCPIMPLLSPFTEKYDFLCPPAFSKIQIGKLRLPRNRAQVDGVIENGTYWVENSTSWNIMLGWSVKAEILEIVKQARKNLRKFERYVIFIAARQADLPADEVNYPDTCFFQLAAPTAGNCNRLKFLSTYTISSRPDAELFNNIRVISSLETIFPNHDITKLMRSATKTNPLPTKRALSVQRQSGRIKKSKQARSE